MTHTEILEPISVDNTIIFISDALRWDMLPAQIRDRSLSIKTVAQSTSTHTAVPTILTGLRPPKHGIYDFSHRRSDDVNSIFQFDGIDSSYFESQTWWQGSSPLIRMLDIDKTCEFDELTEPFFNVVHDRGGHAPHDGSSVFYFEDSARLCDAYNKSVSDSARRLEELIAKVEDHNLREDTLIVIVGDHGELLGEYGGYAGHGYPMCPELVYVPTCFIHPDLIQNIAIDGKIIEQTDILPTALSAMDQRQRSTEGKDVLSESLRDRGYVERIDINSGIRDRGYSAIGVFDAHGGHVFHRKPNLRRFLHFLNDRRVGNQVGKLSPGRIYKMWNKYIPRQVKYGEPSIPASDARQWGESISSSKVASRVRDIDAETKEAMEDLGYLQ